MRRDRRKRLPVSAVSKIFTSLIDGSAVPTGRVGGEKKGEKKVVEEEEEEKASDGHVNNRLISDPAEFLQTKASRNPNCRGLSESSFCGEKQAKKCNAGRFFFFPGWVQTAEMFSLLL